MPKVHQSEVKNRYDKSLEYKWSKIIDNIVCMYSFLSEVHILRKALGGRGERGSNFCFKVVFGRGRRGKKKSDS